MSGLQRRLRVLEGRVASLAPEQDRSEVRARMKAHLDHIAVLRRSDDPADVAELEAFRAAVGRRIEEHRGEGSR